MSTRERALTAFYSGPTWKQHGRQAAATMIDADDVLLLKPVHQTSGFPSASATRPPTGAGAPSSLVSATVYHLTPAAAAEFPQFFRDALRPALHDAGIEPTAWFATESSPNTYPRLPVREGEQVFVWLAGFDSVDAHARALERLAQSPSWTSLQRQLEQQLKSPTQRLRLQPTPRSLLR
jgi:hypothetical protein